MQRLLERIGFGEAATATHDPRGAALEVRGVSLAYGGSVVVNEVTLVAAPGQVICVMGRNGAGKTTLLNGIIGIHGLHAGAIVLDGVEVTRRRSYERARAGIGYVPQGRRIFPHLTVLENLLVGAESAADRNGGQLDEVFTLFPVLKQVGARTAGVLSGGQQQQLAIGRALMGHPRLLLLDEPTEGIQPSIVEEIEAVIGSLRGQMTILLVEQFLDFALASADHCYVIGSGRVVLDGPPTELDAARLRDYLSV
jgi:urea transport system ATP-binding protein